LAIIDQKTRVYRNAVDLDGVGMAAESSFAFEKRYLMLGAQIVGRSQPGDASADDRDFHAALPRFLGVSVA
jgi:hypothetical protein